MSEDDKRQEEAIGRPFWYLQDSDLGLQRFGGATDCPGLEQKPCHPENSERGTLVIPGSSQLQPAL